MRPAILERLLGVQRAGKGWLAFCPAHNDQNKRSLSVGVAEDGKTLLKCHAAGCTAEQITSAVNMTLADLAAPGARTNGHRPAPRREVAAYDYHDERGALLYQVVRFEPKDFRPRRPRPDGAWIWGLGGGLHRKGTDGNWRQLRDSDAPRTDDREFPAARRVVYRLDELAEQRRVFIVEGEKDADRLAALGLPSTTTPSGAESWRDEYAQQLRAAGVEEVTVLPDNDDAGRKYARTAAWALHRLGIAVRAVELPGLPPKGDVSDWLDAGHGKEELLALTDAAPLFTESAVEDAARPLDDLGLADDATPAAPALDLIGAGDFLAVPHEDAVAYIEGILSDDGGGWLGGEEKTGKTWWAIEEAICLALGLPLCGQFAVPQQRRVLLLEEEDSPRRTQRRLRAIVRGHGLDPDAADTRAELNAWLKLCVWSGFSLDNADLIAQLRTRIDEFRPAVVYIDCLRKVTLRDLNKAPEASGVLVALDHLRREFGVIFRVIHHYRKTQGFRAGRGSQEIGGSFVLGAWGENSLFFEPIGRKQGAVRVEVQSKDGAPVPGFRLRIESEGPAHAPSAVRLVIEEDGGDENEVDEQVHQAVASLPAEEPAKGKPGVPAKSIASAIKKSLKTVRRALARLVDADRCLVTGTMSKGAKLYGAKRSDDAQLVVGQDSGDQP